MTKLTYNSENKRIATAIASVAVIPMEDLENKRIEIISSDLVNIVFETTGDGYYTIKDQTIEEEYVDPASLNLTVDEDGYSSVPE